MWVVRRYILVELMRVFAVAFCVITLFFVFHGIVDELLLKGLGPGQIIQILPFLLPEALRNAVQGAMLYAVCCVFGRMAATNELLAANSLGISSLAIVWPALWLASALSLVCVWLNDVDSWWGYNGVQVVVLESTEEVIGRTLRNEGSYTTKQIAIHVARMDGSTLVRPTLMYWPTQGGAPVTISAQSGRMRTDLKKRTLSIEMKNGTVEVGSELSVSFPDTMEHVVPLREVINGEPDWPPLWQPLRLLGREIQRQRGVVSKLAQQIAASPSQPEAPKVTPPLEISAQGQLRDQLRIESERLSKLETQPHRRWANGFCCLSFVAIGIPVTIRLRSADYLTSFFLCFMPIIMAYQPIQFFGIDLAQAGWLPPWATWFGNAVLLLCGALMMERIFLKPAGSFR